MEAGPFPIVPSYKLENFKSIGQLNLHKYFQKMMTASNDYLVTNDLENLHELREGGFLEGDSVMDEGGIEEKGIFKCEICGKQCVLLVV